MTTTLRVWIAPEAKTNGYTEEKFVEEVLAGCNLPAAVCDFRAKLVTKLSKSDIQIKTKELYLGNGSHARGLYDPRTPKVLYVHSGYISAGHHSGKLGPKDKPLPDYKIINPGTLHRIVCHERLHQIGWAHSSDAKCIMHAAVGPGLCESEIKRLVQRYGKPKAQPEAAMREELNNEPIEMTVSP